MNFIKYLCDICIKIFEIWDLLLFFFIFINCFYWLIISKRDSLVQNLHDQVIIISICTILPSYIWIIDKVIRQILDIIDRFYQFIQWFIYIRSLVQRIFKSKVWHYLLPHYVIYFVVKLRTDFLVLDKKTDISDYLLAAVDLCLLKCHWLIEIVVKSSWDYISANLSNPLLDVLIFIVLFFVFNIRVNKSISMLNWIGRLLIFEHIFD